MWSEILGAVIGPLTEGMASAAQYQASKHERNISWKRMGQWELIAPSLRMQGLRNAGLNPILAANPPGGGGGANIPEASTGGSPNFAFDMGRVYAAAKQRKIMDSMEREAAATALIREREADAAKYLPEKAYHAAGAEAERWSNLRESVALLREQQASTAAQTERTKVDTRMMETELPSARALEDLYSRYPWLRQLGAALKDIRR